MNAMPDMVCQLCGEPINRVTKPSGSEEWKHGRMEGYDHEPDPIPLAEALTVNYMCDFCSGDGVRWFYPTGTRITHTLAAAASVSEEVHDISYHRRTRAMQVHSTGAVRQDVVAPKAIADNVFSDNWTACDPCSTVIELDDVERLVTHLRRRKPAAFATVSRKLLKDHFSEFYRLRQPRRPIEEANQ